MKTKNVYIFAGPNGSGKTTFARTFLPEYAKCDRFINADLIASGLSPFSPQQVAIKSGKLVLEQIKEYRASGVDFGFERSRDKNCVYCGIEMLESVSRGSSRKNVATWEHIINDASIVTRENIALCCADCNSSS